MSFIRYGTAALLTGALGIAACGDGDTECPTVTLEFPEGETSLERSALKTLREGAKKTLEACPHVHVESYIAGDDEETARMRKNHVKNLFSVIFEKESKSRTDAVIPAPSDDLAGKVKVTYSATAPE